MACVFCDIVRGEGRAAVVHRDERVLAFCDIHPVNPGHLLVVPLRHAVGLADLDPGDAARMFVVAQRLAAAVHAARLPCDGVNLFLADGAPAGQEVFHTHLHVVPRLIGDRFRLESGQSPVPPPWPDLDAVAGAVRAALS